MYKTPPVENFINRNNDNHQLNNYLKELSQLIEEYINFGSNLFKWSLDKYPITEENLPIILLVRHIIEILDGLSILVEKSSIEPSKILLRGSLESYFLLEFIFENNTSNRCLAFLYFYALNNKRKYERFDISTNEGRAFETALRNDKLLKGSVSLLNNPFRAEIENLNSLLNLSKFHSVVEEIKSYRRHHKNKPPKSWYELFGGSNNMQEISKIIRQDGLYKLFYKDWSDKVHGTDILKGNFSSDGIHQIRFPSDAESVTFMCCTILHKTYNSFVENYIPEKRPDLKTWYLGVRDYYLKLNDTKIKVKF